MLLLADLPVPEGRGGILVHRLAADAGRRAQNPLLGPRQAHPQLLSIPAGRGDRKGPGGPAVHQIDGLPLAAGPDPGTGHGGDGQHLEAQIQQHPEGTEGPGHESGDVVAGDVLHHLAAEAQHLAAPREHPGTEHQVAGSTRVGPGRAGETAG
ncbi:MAG: hypothetical protein H6R22_1607, partial [Chromatiaceae bacterium]|nr:hypothetical protein [Chromatiaceae bacterium]